VLAFVTALRVTRRKEGVTLSAVIVVTGIEVVP